MLPRLALVVAVSVVLGTPRMVMADPIKWDFTASLNKPVDGSKAMSGSITFGGTSILELGVNDVSVTLNLGGQVFNFQDNPQDSSSGTVSFDVIQSQPFQSWPGGPSEPIAEFYLSAINNQVKFFMTDYVSGISLNPPFSPTANFSAADLLHGDAGFNFSLNATEGAVGSITSMELVPTPEPSALFIFAGLGVAAMIRNRCGGSRGRRQPA